MGNLISLKEWSEKNGIAEVTARQRAARGSFETARKIGRNWVIDEDEKLIDHRFKDKSEDPYYPECFGDKEKKKGCISCESYEQCKN